MFDNAKITITDISNVLGISRDTVNEHIAKLKKEGILQRTGGRKEGSWKVNL